MMEEINDIKLSEYREAFLLFDKDNNGKISVQELGKVMKSLNQEPSAEELNDIIGEVDLDHNGEIEFEEFISLMNNRIKENDAEEDIILAFKSFDKDGKGLIPSVEIRDILLNYTDNLSEEEIDQMIEECEFGNTGFVDYEKFIREMMNLLC